MLKYSILLVISVTDYSSMHGSYRKLKKKIKVFKKQSIRDAALCVHFLCLPTPKKIESLLQKIFTAETIQDTDLASDYFNFGAVREVR